MADNVGLRASAILWIAHNTTYDTTVDEFPPNIELFIEKYTELMMSLRPGIASESISGLSQSFASSEITTILKQYARVLIGEFYMLSDVRAIPAVDRWVY